MYNIKGAGRDMFFCTKRYITKQNNISSFEQMDADDFCVAAVRITYLYPDTPASIMHSKR